MILLLPLAEWAASDFNSGLTCNRTLRWGDWGDLNERSCSVVELFWAIIVRYIHLALELFTHIIFVETDKVSLARILSPYKRILLAREQGLHCKAEEGDRNEVL